MTDYWLPRRRKIAYILGQQLTANSVIAELVQAQESFDNLMQGVYFAMKAIARRSELWI